MTEWLRNLLDPGWITVGTAVVLALATSIFNSVGPQAAMRRLTQAPSPERKLWYRPEALGEYLGVGEASAAERAPTYQKALWWDLGFAALYGTGLAIVLHGTLGAALKGSSRWPLVVAPMIALPIAATIADWFETGFLIAGTRRIMAGTDGGGPVRLARVGSFFKWLFVGLTGLLILAGALGLAIKGPNMLVPTGILALIFLSVGLVGYQSALSFLEARRDLPRWGVGLFNIAAAVGVGAIGALIFDLSLDQAGMAASADASARALRWTWPFAAAIVVGTVLVIAIPSLRRRCYDSRYSKLSGGRIGLEVLRILLATALFEEIAFRGVLFGAWRAVPYSEAVAVGWSAVAFGLWHIGPALARVRKNRPGAQTQDERAAILGTVLFTAVGGVFFGLLRLWSGTIWAGVVVHWLLNSAGVIAAKAAGNDPSRT